MVDGDGTVRIRRKKGYPCISLNGQLAIIESFLSFLSYHKIGTVARPARRSTIFCVEFAGPGIAASIIRLLYEGAGTALGRKRRSALLATGLEFSGEIEPDPGPSVPPVYDMRLIKAAEVRALCERHHAYGSAGDVFTYAFGVFEEGALVAAYAWQPPPPGTADAVCPEAPQGVLALSRMVAVPSNERRLRHVSKPLRRQMLTLIDRTRWPVLVTYSDEGLGHSGHVYKCSGWTSTERAERVYYLDAEDRRASFTTSDKDRPARGLRRGGTTILQRWEHWICEQGQAGDWMRSQGWRRVEVPGKVWRSGNQAFTYVRSGTPREP